MPLDDLGKVRGDDRGRVDDCVAEALGTLSAEESAELRRLNAAYVSTFGFPFVICARQNRKDAILGTLRARLSNTREQEIANAIAQIGEIARLRIADLVE